MSFVIDTDICSAYLRGHRQVFNRFVQYSGGLHVSAITAGELYVWANRSSSSPRLLDGLEKMLAHVGVIDVNVSLAKTFGSTRAALLDQGVSVAVNDMFIAAAALHHNFTLVTHNVRHFSLVPALRIQDWLDP